MKLTKHNPNYSNPPVEVSVSQALQVLVGSGSPYAICGIVGELINLLEVKGLLSEDEVVNLLFSQKEDDEDDIIHVGNYIAPKYQKPPVALYHTDEVTMFHSKNQKTRELWNQYAQKSANDWNENHSYDKQAGMMYMWTPPLQFSAWYDKYIKGKQDE